MRTAVMILLTMFVWSLESFQAAYGQTCESIRKLTSSDLVSYLGSVVPDEKNKECISWAISQLGVRHYEPAADVLARFLDFRRPLNENEKAGFYLRTQGVGDVYPAVDALALIGTKALPIVLRVIKADASSTKARQNAVFVWMEIYRYSDEHPKGVALLKAEEVNAKDSALRERLKWAVSNAASLCNPPEEAACRRAVETGAP